MKITFKCIKKEEDVNGAGIIYGYRFGVKSVSQDLNVQRTFGDLYIKSVEPLHFKPGKEYTVLVSDLLTLDVGDLSKKLN